MTTFDDFWSAYPKRKGSNPKHPASLKFASAVKNGADPAHIVSSAARYHDEAAEQGNIDTPYICMASTWLNQKRWLDYAPVAPVEPKPKTDMDDRWLPVREKLVVSLGEDVVASWLDDLKIISMDGQTAQLKAPSKFVKSWVETRYMDRLSEAWIGVNSGTTRLEILL